MPSKTSKKPKHSPRRSRWKAVRACSEAGLHQLAEALARELKRGDRVILEGPMGAGKSTFARELIRSLGVKQLPEGSPTFAIAHEYKSPISDIAHLDLYRIKSELELEEAGIPAYFWERELITIVEWLSLFKNFEEAVVSRSADRRNWRVDIAFAEDPALRVVEISRL